MAIDRSMGFTVQPRCETMAIDPLMRPRLVSVAFLLGLAGLAACRGKVAGTAHLAGPGAADASFTSTGQPLVLWADTDGEWIGNDDSHFSARYEIDVLANGKKLTHLACDTRASKVSVCGTKMTVGMHQREDCELKLACELPPIPAGPASIHVVGALGPETVGVKNMSINVREK